MISVQKSALAEPASDVMAGVVRVGDVQVLLLRICQIIVGALKDGDAHNFKRELNFDFAEQRLVLSSKRQRCRVTQRRRAVLKTFPQ